MATTKNTKVTAPKKRVVPVKKPENVKSKVTPVTAVSKNEMVIAKSPFWNIWDTGLHYKVRVSIPGLTKKNIKVDVKGKGITISSEKDTQKQTVDKNYLVREYIYNSWSKTFDLPQRVNPRTVHIRYKDGVLKLDLQKVS